MISLARLPLVLALVSVPLAAQLTTGTVHGTLRGVDGRPAAGVPIVVSGALGFRVVIHSGAEGAFAVTLPYGRYRFSDSPVLVAPLQITAIDLMVDASGVVRGPTPQRPSLWTDATGGRVYPEGFSLSALLLSREPSTVAEPLDFTGLTDNRAGVVSQRGFSWTATQSKLQGAAAADAWQPGVPLAFPDTAALEAVVAPNNQVAVFLAQPEPSWHVTLSTADTGSAFASANLPAPASRGMVQQAEQFRWMTRDALQVAGPLTRWADIFAAASGQWGSQAEPLDSPGTRQRSRLLFANTRGRVRAGAKDQFDTLYSGSRIDLSDGGLPAGLEALAGNRMAPSFVLPGGFPGDPETDHFDFVQLGWTRFLPEASSLGNLEVRYTYSTAHLDTSTSQTGQSTVELVGGVVSGAPPLANLATRPRHQIQGTWQPASWRTGKIRHQVTAAGGWERSQIRNRFSAPSSQNLITANGLPAFVLQFNTPLDSRELVQSFSGSAADHVSLTPSLSVDAGLLADFWRGSLPAQSSPAGGFAPARSFGAQPDLISWNSLAPRAALAWQPPHAHGLVLRGAYSRVYTPLAGRYLDFGNANSLGGSAWQPGPAGSLLLHFGGPYSSISPALRRPCADEFDLAAQLPLTRRTIAGIHLFRRDEKHRIAAIDTGVPSADFTPVSILDPGPDGIPGTFDDRRLTVYAQNPGTLGQDQYLLTNPPGLRMLNTGLLAEAGTEWRALSLHASFVAEKSYGPTNPGDAVYQNDPGVIGALFLDPNTAIHAAGRSFVDRAYVGKVQAAYRLPKAWGGIDVAALAAYMDGLVFARQLLVTGLPQGPFLVAATVRGSPEGGNRAQYVLNSNLRVSRRFALPLGAITAAADLLNANNSAQRVQESDVSGPSFNLRLPVAIQPARFLRIGFCYQF